MADWHIDWPNGVMTAYGVILVKQVWSSGQAEMKWYARRLFLSAVPRQGDQVLASHEAGQELVTVGQVIHVPRPTDNIILYVYQVVPVSDQDKAGWTVLKSKSASVPLVFPELLSKKTAPSES